MPFTIFAFTILFYLLSFPSAPVCAAPAAAATKADERSSSKSDHDEYLAYFEEVYKVMDSNYYFELRRQDYDRFLKIFEEKIYKNLLLEGKSSDYVRWRSDRWG